ncbi:two-component sensor histidine kinase [Geomicrobium sp. JCM 19037]|uniref:sensor histidine kinase n=1 Tax=Geomicrobium sp. JCM 19037 TaxID=1460634 RepID=UPI00045F25ED|nr:histidine kinase [Geomicrobium sp. JCM 19037]GAK05927.1 two-component sensor histidine kinase [Geomicrobium sp. JCM 19037]
MIKVLISAREIKKRENLSLNHLGFLYVYIDVDDLISAALNFAPEQNFVIADDKDLIYSSTMESGEIKELLAMPPIESYEIATINNEAFFIIELSSKHSNLSYFNIVELDNINDQKAYISLMIFLYIFFMVIVTIFISRQSAKAISKPIERLTKNVKKVQEGNFEVVPDHNQEFLKDEIGDLQENFYVMVDKINSLIKENYEKQLIIKETEYRALQAQINPHFFYNTLDSIHWMAKVSDQKKIAEMAEALGSMMRGMVSKKGPLITVGEELAIVESYITIQQSRYNERLVFRLYCEEQLKKASIPKLTIQPIIENAIKHGWKR